MEPARLNAMSRGVGALIDLLTFGDRDMETIRREETEQTAAAITGIPGNLDLLETIDDVSARQDRYRSQSLIDRDLAELVPSPDPDQPPQTRPHRRRPPPLRLPPRLYHHTEGNRRLGRGP